MSKKIFLIGAGGHAKTIMDIMNSQGIQVDAIVSKKSDSSYDFLKNIMNMDDDKVFNYSPNEVFLANGIGSVPGNSARASIFKKFRDQSYEFLSIKSEASIVSNLCKIGMGVQVMPGAIVNTGAIIGENTIINSGAIIEHDCVIGKIIILPQER